MALNKLAGTVAAITGGTRGIGRAIAERLLDEGVRVAICGTTRESVDRALEDLAGRGELLGEVADVSKLEDVQRFVAATMAGFGRIDAFINNAGVGTFRAAGDLTPEEWHRMIGVNLTGTYYCCHEILPIFRQQGSGDIVNITTDHIHTCGWPELLDHTHAQECPWKDVQRPPVGSKNFDIYDSSKWGIKGITNAWARDLAPHKIRVNSFGMGATITPMFLSVLGDRPLPSGTMQAGDIANLIVELIAEGPEGRTGDDVQVWAGHPTVLPPVGLEGRLTMIDLVGKN
jgi:NAD(P)-dependent dehydrogenase (short-subunit alcohol dehydrogenase family)